MSQTQAPSPQPTWKGLCQFSAPYTLSPDGTTHILGSPCPAHAAGTPMLQMNQNCQVCQWRALDLPAIWAEQAREASAAAAAQLQAPQPQAALPPGLAAPLPAAALISLASPAPQAVQPAALSPAAAEVALAEAAPVQTLPAAGGAPSSEAPSSEAAPSTMISAPWLVADADPNDIVQKALESLGLAGGPSEGGISWHTLENCKCWRRAFLAIVQGLRQKVRGYHYAFGTLYHACLEQHYLSGGNPEKTFAPCEAVRLAGAAELAREVHQLLYAQLTNPTFVTEESQTWCPRGVETNAVCWIPAQRINGKSIAVPISCRHDLLVHLKQPHESAPPLGPCSNMHISDHKTTSALTADLVKGYALDGQLMTNAVCYIESEEEQFGPLRGVIVTIAAKHKTPGPQSFVRVVDGIDRQSVATFYKDELVPLATELVRRLTDASYLEDITKWPMNRMQCAAKFPCPFFELCAFGEAESYKFVADPKRQLRVENEEMFWKPKKGFKTTLLAAQVAPEEQVQLQTKSEEKKVAAAARKQKKGDLGKLVQGALVDYIADLKHFQPSRYLVSGHTEKSVKAKLIEAISTTFRATFDANIAASTDGDTKGRPDIALAVAPEDNAPEISFTILPQKGDRGLSWVSEDAKGTLTWRALAEDLCHDWWSLDNLQQTVSAAPPAPPPMASTPLPPMQPVPQVVAAPVPPPTPAAPPPPAAPDPMPQPPQASPAFEAIVQAAVAPAAPLPPAQLPAAPNGPLVSIVRRDGSSVPVPPAPVMPPPIPAALPPQALGIPAAPPPAALPPPKTVIDRTQLKP